MGDLEDDGDDEVLVWEWNDRHTVTALGTQQPRLTYAPVDEALSVFWHPGGHGGLPLTNEMFTVDDHTVVIPDTGYFALGDTFSFQYPHLDEEPDPIDPTVVGATAPGTYDSSAHTLTVAMPPGTTAGDLLALVVRGGTSVSGGEGTTTLSISDARMSRVFTALSGPVAGVWTGVADGSGSPIVVNITEPAGNFGAVCVLAAIGGANGFGPVVSAESPSPVPQVAALAAVAMSWNHYTFATNDLDPPTGYTDVASSGINYPAADLAFWFDPDATISPVSTSLGEGVVIVGLV
jgi:hypothetical protein